MSSERIWALVSGYPHRLRANKVLVFMQAFIDDSVAERGDGRLFMAGYVNTVEEWARFSDDWDTVLKRQPSIEYLSMKEANSQRGQFRGWADPRRDIKLAKLAMVIRRYKPKSFHFTIDRAAYLDKVKPVTTRGLASAHYAGTFGVVAMVTRYLAKVGFDGKVDFIFDEQSGVSADVHLFFEYMARNLTKAQRAMVARTPQFGSDKDFLPLQAADMLAWHIRRQHECGDVGRMLDRLLPHDGAHLVMETPPELIEAWAEAMALIPGVSQLQSKASYQKFRARMGKALARGFIPPRGTRWKNFLFEVQQRIFYWRLMRRRRKRP